jgi:quinohemoprotein ethanol dehydrogenase
VIAEGGALYNRTCGNCHGFNARSGGVIKDLREMSPATHAEFDDIVLGGARASAGMASYADVLSAREAEAIHAYLVMRANEDWGRQTDEQ